MKTLVSGSAYRRPGQRGSRFPGCRLKDTQLPSRTEYVTIRWAGKENTHLIRPGGQVEFIGGELRKLPKPERCDERSFYMNAAVNGLGQGGLGVGWNDLG